MWSFPIVKDSFRVKLFLRVHGLPQALLRHPARESAASYRNKMSHFPVSGVILLHDNARFRTFQVVTDILASYNWEALPHPAYSPDLSPCDFFLFGKLKSKLRGQEFQTEDAINQATKEALVELAKGGYHAGIFGLQKRWEQCIP